MVEKCQLCGSLGRKKSRLGETIISLCHTNKITEIIYLILLSSKDLIKYFNLCSYANWSTWSPSSLCAGRVMKNIINSRLQKRQNKEYSVEFRMRRCEKPVVTLLPWVFFFLYIKLCNNSFVQFLTSFILFSVMKWYHSGFLLTEEIYHLRNLPTNPKKFQISHIYARNNWLSPQVKTISYSSCLKKFVNHLKFCSRV